MPQLKVDLIVDDQGSLAIKKFSADTDRYLRTASGSVENFAGKLNGLTGILSGVAAAFGAWGIGNFVKDIALAAARFETLGVSMGVVGNNAGYTRAEMEQMSQALQKNGIAMMESRQVLTQMAQANIDLSKATDLARVAQDAAVIGNINSSLAFEQMIYGIQSGQVDVLKTIGINVSFENSYKKVTEQLGRTTASLSENEKMQIRANAVLEDSVNIAGVYEAAMGTAGKQLLSMKRYTDNLKISTGSVFNDLLIVSVGGFTDALKEANGEMTQLTADKSLEQWGKGLVYTFAVLGDTIKLPFKAIAEFTDELIGLGFTVSKFFEMTEELTSGNVAGAKQRWSELKEINNDLSKRTAARWENAGSDLVSAADKMYADRIKNAEKEAAAQDALEKKRIAAGKAARDLANQEKENAAGMEKAEKTAKEYQKTVEQLTDKYLPLKKEEEEVAQATKVFSDLLAKGVITQQEYATAMDNVTKSTEAYKKQIEEIEALDSFYSLTPEQEAQRTKEVWQTRIDKQHESEKLSKEMADKEKERLQEYEKAFEHMLENLQDYGADFFYDWFSGAEDGWKNLMGNLKNYFIRMLAELAAAAIARPIMVSVVGSVAGGLGMSNIASAATSSGALSNLGIVGDLMGAFGGHGGIMGNLSSMAGWEWIQDAAGAVVDFSSDLAGVAESISNFGAWVESIPVVGKMGAAGVMSAAFAISDLLSGNTKGAITNGIGAGLSMINPVLGAAWGVGNWIGSTFFGSDEPEPEYKARYQVKSQTHSQHRMLWQNTGTKGEDIGQSATNQINQAIFDLMLQWDKNLLSLADAMGESGKKWQQSIKYAFDINMNQDINSAADVETLLNRMNESIFDNLAPTLNQGLDIFWADTKAGMSKLPVWNLMSSEWLANINSQVASLPKLSAADTAEQGLEKFNTFVQEVAGIDTWMQGVNTLVDDIRSSLRGETTSEFEKSYLAVEEQFASWEQQLKDLGINLKKFPELAAALNKSLTDLTAGAFDSIQDVIDKHELSDQAYAIKSGMPAVQEWYDEQLAMLDFLAGENRLTGGDYAGHLADLNKAMAYKIDDLQGSAENAIDQWDEFFRSMQLSDLAPGQSLEGYLAEYQTLKSAGDFSALADFVKGDFLPFVQSYTAGTVDYATIYKSVMSDMQGVAYSGSTGSTSVTLDSASTAVIAQAVASGMLSITDSTGKEIVINLNLDSRTLDTVIAGLITGGGVTFEAIKAVS